MTGRARLGLGALAATGVALALWGLVQMDRREGPGVSSRDSAGGEAMLQTLVSTLDPSGAAPLSGPWEVSLHRDHGAHPEAQAETWSLSAQLEDEAGDPLSVGIVLTRLGAAGPEADMSGRWSPGPVHVGQLVVTSPMADLRGTDERLGRNADTAGFDMAAQQLRIDDWTLDIGASGMVLRIRTGRLELSFEPMKEPLAIDADAGPATRGFAIPRLSVTGRLIGEGGPRDLTGVAWLDRLWGALPLPGGPLERDRMVLHLSDGTDLTLLRTRRRGGGGITALDGLLVAPDGSVTTVTDATVELRAEETGLETSWRISGAGLDLRADVLDVLQRRDFGQSGRVGQLRVTGTRDGTPVEGVGSLFLSGDSAS
jgi:predicted secreted hydrolase